MICKHCGKEIPDHSLFCPECGSKLEPEHDKTTPSPGHADENIQRAVKPAKPAKDVDEFSGNRVNRATESGEAGSGKQHGGNQKIVIGIVAAAIVLALVIIGVVTHRPSINLNKYLTVSFDGYNKYGTASVNFDSDKFDKDYGKVLKKKTKAAKNRLDSLGVLGQLGSDLVDSVASYYFTGTLDKTENLSNGDTVTYTWNFDADSFEKMYRVKLKYKDQEFTVNGLQELESFDPFANVTVEFNGVEPDGEAVIDNSGAKADEQQDLRYSLDPSDGLSNGDTVVLKCSLPYGSSDLTTYFATQYGKIPSSLTKEITVSGLGKYVTSLSDISAEALEQMKNQAKDIMQTDIARNWSSAENLADSSYVGEYLLVAKPNMYANYHNILMLLFKQDIHYKDENYWGRQVDSTQSIYWPCIFYNIEVDPDGNCDLDLSDYSTGSSSSMEFPTTDGNDYISVYHTGYLSLDDAYNDFVASNVDKYTYDANVNGAGVPDASAASTLQDSTAADTTQQSMASTETEDTTTAPTTASAPETEKSSEAYVQTANGDDPRNLIPDISSRALTDADIASLSKDQLQLAINTLYAEHGYIFKSQKLQDYFKGFDWYQPTIVNSQFNTDQQFSEVERNNCTFLRNHIDG